MSEYLISVKDLNNKYKHYPVTKEVYLYIKQLESYILNPENSKLKTLYKERFK